MGRGLIRHMTQRNLSVQYHITMQFCVIILKITILTYFQWDGGAIVQMGWSVSEDLLCVADDGSVFVYDIHGAIKKTLTMGQVSEVLW